MKSKLIHVLVLLIGLINVCQAINQKLDCFPIEGASKEQCKALGCIWEPVSGTSAGKSRVDEPWCYFPDDYEGYRVVLEDDLNISADKNQFPSKTIKLKRVKKSALGNDIDEVNVEFGMVGKALRMRLTDSQKTRFEPELPKLSYQENYSQQSQFSIELSSPYSSGKTYNDGINSTLTIRRSPDGVDLFSTDFRRLIFSDKFIQINSLLTSPYLYGLGEHFGDFLKMAKDEYKTYSFWNSDQLPLPGGQRSYGGFPFYVGFDKITSDKNNNASSGQEIGRAFGVYLHNSNAMDIVLHKDVSITFRPIGGLLDFYIFPGPKPLDVVQQFQALVGKPALPPRWALGFHLCRYNYGSLEKTKLVWKRTRDAGIPFDVQWNDIDYMERYNDFTYDKVRFAGLPEFVDELHEKFNMHYMLLLDPGLSQEQNYYPYKLGDKLDIWIKNATNQTLVGKVWNQSGRTVFPDFSNPKSHQFWSELFVKFQQEIKFDGAWIDMNDISNFVDGSLDGCPKRGASSDTELPPYKPGGYDLQHHSLCLSARHHNDQLEYNLHNLYSFYEAIATRKALLEARPNKRSLIISRSTHPGQGSFGGHWSGDVRSNWEYLRWSIPSLLEHSMYGFAMMGTDICGFSGNTTPELCARWSTLGAFYTFSRNHNDDVSIDQDPVALGQAVVKANKNAYTKKYSLLPYFYTLLFKAHMHGEPVARSLSFEFFKHLNSEQEVLSVETQFMVGSALMVSPIVIENTYQVSSYLPKGRWYKTDILPESAHKAPALIDSSGQQFASDNVSLDNLVLFIRGGHILPVYNRVGPTIADTVRGQPIGLEVALCQMKHARGSLLYDDGEALDIAINHIEMIVHERGLLNLTMIDNNYEKETRFDQVRVYGLADEKVSSVKLLNSGEVLPFTQEGHMLKFNLNGASLSKGSSMIIQWS